LIVQTFVGLVRQLMLGPRPGEAPSKDRDLPLTLLVQDYTTTNLRDTSLGSIRSQGSSTCCMQRSTGTLRKKVVARAASATAAWSDVFLNSPEPSLRVVKFQRLPGDGILQTPNTTIGVIGRWAHPLQPSPIPALLRDRPYLARG
jgi:hypothetical protein